MLQFPTRLPVSDSDPHFWLPKLFVNKKVVLSSFFYGSICLLYYYRIILYFTYKRKNYEARALVGDARSAARRWAMYRRVVRGPDRAPCANV